MRTTLSIRDPLFISAPNGGGLLYAHRHLLLPLLREDATGLSVTADGLLWCVQADGSGSLREVRQGQLRTMVVAQTPLDLHDVLVGPGGVHAVCTETNEVVRLDAAGTVQERWRFGDEPDSAHVNCIVWHGNRLLASMFGQFATHRGYKGHTHKAGRVVDVHGGQTLIDGLSQPHSLVSVGDELWLCSSEDRAILVYDNQFNLRRSVQLPGYARGLAVAADCVYVGISRSRNLEFAETGEFATAVIGILDRASLAVVGYVPTPWNEIYDIRIVPSELIITDVMASLWVAERGQYAEDHQRQLQAHQAELQDRTDALSVASQSATDAVIAWKTEKEVRGVVERLAQRHAEEAREARAAWQSEQGVRIAAEQAAQRYADEAREARTASQSERRIRMAAEDAAQRHAEEARDARAAWQSEQGIRVAAEQAARTQAIEARGEIVKRDARITVLEQARADLQQLKASRSWRWTRPLRFLLRVLRHRGISPEDRRKLGWSSPQDGTVASSAGMLGVLPTAMTSGEAAAAPAPAIRLATQSAGQRDYFVWAVIDWHFRIQRPQHLARELAAAGHRVFYVSNNFIDRAEPGFSVEALDSDGRLFQINLHLKDSPAIYHAAPDATAREQLRADIGLLLGWTRSRGCVSLVQHPYWLETAQMLPDLRLVYDCMDHHGGFADNSADVLAREHELMRDADLLVVTSDWLYEEAGKYNPHRVMIRNACQYEHFSTPPAQRFKDDKGRRVIGYYGAIAEWFDLDLLETLAHRFDDCLILLVGADTTGAQQRLRHLSHVQFTGEVSYSTLPYYLDAFDVCLLPFQVIPLTLATNPVKVYEYLSAGKEVVSIELPEIRQFGELVRTGTDHASFLHAVSEALAAVPQPAVIARRQQFAAGQTWAHRVHDLVQGVDALPEPRVSVIVVTYNNLDLTKVCLRSLELYSDYTNLEVIVVDNASADDTPAYLQTWAASGKDRQIILNPDNRGFAAANNQGLAVASGDYLVLLNNDTHVTLGWIATLVAHLRHSKTLGMIGPVTNNIGNEARIDISYDDMDGMLHAAADYTTRHAGQLTPLRTAAFFCVMMCRSVYEKVGPLDEAFGIGFFEDDDYCRRVEQAGWAIACADDVFVHHNLSASFNKLKQETRQTLFEQNKLLYEAKWGAWSPHKYREQ